MIDQKILRTDINEVTKLLLRKGYTLNVENWNKWEKKRAKIQVKNENQQAELNTISKEIGILKSQGDVNPVLEKQASKLSKLIKDRNKVLDSLLDDIKNFLLDVPNLPDSDVPLGDSEDDNILVRQSGKKPDFNFKIRDHVELGELHGSLDFDASSEIVGSRFVVMKNNFAKLHRALIQFMMDFHLEFHGYTEVYVPYIISGQSLIGTGQLPKFEEDLFKLEGSNNFYLTPTAEVPVTNLFKDKILESKDLPIKYVCHTPCFRSEAGSYGKDTRGMMRQHQFEKVELVQAVEGGNSNKALEELTLHAEAILKALDMPYRVVSLCAGDLGFGAAKTYDIEVWVPSQNTYREISSCTNYRDFQARRMKARWKTNDSNKPKLINTVNGSGLAAGRALLALLELNQLEDGSIVIPKALRKYMNINTLKIN